MVWLPVFMQHVWGEGYWNKATEVQVKTKHSGVQCIPFSVAAIALLSSERALYRIFHDNAYSPHQFKTVCSPRTLYNEGNIYFSDFWQQHKLTVIATLLETYILENLPCILELLDKGVFTFCYGLWTKPV